MYFAKKNEREQYTEYLKHNFKLMLLGQRMHSNFQLKVLRLNKAVNKIMSAMFQKIFGPSYISLKNQRLEGKIRLDSNESAQYELPHLGPPGSEVIKLFPFSTQLNLKFFPAHKC